MIMLTTCKEKQFWENNCENQMIFESIIKYY